MRILSNVLELWCDIFLTSKQGLAVTIWFVLQEDGLNDPFPECQIDPMESKKKLKKRGTIDDVLGPELRKLGLAPSMGSPTPRSRPPSVDNAEAPNVQESDKRPVSTQSRKSIASGERGRNSPDERQTEGTASPETGNDLRRSQTSVTSRPSTAGSQRSLPESERSGSLHTFPTVSDHEVEGSIPSRPPTPEQLLRESTSRASVISANTKPESTSETLANEGVEQSLNKKDQSEKTNENPDGDIAAKSSGNGTEGCSQTDQQTDVQNSSGNSEQGNVSNISSDFHLRNPEVSRPNTPIRSVPIGSEEYKVHSQSTTLMIDEMIKHAIYKAESNVTKLEESGDLDKSSTSHFSARASSDAEIERVMSTSPIDYQKSSQDFSQKEDEDDRKAEPAITTPEPQKETEKPSAKSSQESEKLSDYFLRRGADADQALRSTTRIQNDDPAESENAKEENLENHAETEPQTKTLRTSSSPVLKDEEADTNNGSIIEESTPEPRKPHTAQVTKKEIISAEPEQSADNLAVLNRTDSSGNSVNSEVKQQECTTEAHAAQTEHATEGDVVQNEKTTDGNVTSPIKSNHQTKLRSPPPATNDDDNSAQRNVSSPTKSEEENRNRSPVHQNHTGTHTARNDSEARNGTPDQSNSPNRGNTPAATETEDTLAKSDPPVPNGVSETDNYEDSAEQKGDDNENETPIHSNTSNHNDEVPVLACTGSPVHHDTPVPVGSDSPAGGQSPRNSDTPRPSDCNVHDEVPVHRCTDSPVLNEASVPARSDSASRAQISPNTDTQGPSETTTKINTQTRPDSAARTETPPKRSNEISTRNDTPNTSDSPVQTGTPGRTETPTGRHSASPNSDESRKKSKTPSPTKSEQRTGTPTKRQESSVESENKTQASTAAHTENRADTPASPGNSETKEEKTKAIVSTTPSPEKSMKPPKEKKRISPENSEEQTNQAKTNNSEKQPETPVRRSSSGSTKSNKEVNKGKTPSPVRSESTEILDTGKPPPEDKDASDNVVDPENIAKADDSQETTDPSYFHHEEPEESSAMESNSVVGSESHEPENIEKDQESVNSSASVKNENRKRASDETTSATTKRAEHKETPTKMKSESPAHSKTGTPEQSGDAFERSAAPTPVDSENPLRKKAEDQSLANPAYFEDGANSPAASPPEKKESVSSRSDKVKKSPPKKPVFQTPSPPVKGARRHERRHTESPTSSEEMGELPSGSRRRSGKAPLDRKESRHSVQFAENTDEDDMSSATSPVFPKRRRNTPIPTSRNSSEMGSEDEYEDDGDDEEELSRVSSGNGTREPDVEVIQSDEGPKVRSDSDLDAFRQSDLAEATENLSVDKRKNSAERPLSPLPPRHNSEKENNEPPPRGLYRPTAAFAAKMRPMKKLPSGPLRQSKSASPKSVSPRSPRGRPSYRAVRVGTRPVAKNTLGTLRGPPKKPFTAFSHTLRDTGKPLGPAWKPVGKATLNSNQRISTPPREPLPPVTQRPGDKRYGGYPVGGPYPPDARQLIITGGSRIPSQLQSEAWWQNGTFNITIRGPETVLPPLPSCLVSVNPGKDAEEETDNLITEPIDVQITFRPDEQPQSNYTQNYFRGAAPIRQGTRPDRNVIESRATHPTFNTRIDTPKGVRGKLRPNRRPVRGYVIQNRNPINPNTPDL